MSVVSTGKKLRILCLHGHRHNSALMELHMAPLRRALGDSAEFVFMNGVSLARDEPDKVPFYEWYDVRRLEEDEDQDDEWLFQYEGLDDAILYMDEQLQRLGTSDVVLSFAQGVVLMTILSMHYEHKNRGLQASDDAGEKLLVPLPSTHLAGKKDPLHCEAEELVHQFAGDKEGTRGVKKLFLEYDEGHQFSSEDKYPMFYSELGKSIHEMCAGNNVQQQPKQVYSRL